MMTAQRPVETIMEHQTLASPTSDGSSSDLFEPRKVAVLGLPWETSEEALQLHFGQFGPLEGVEVMRDRFTGKSRGFAFVTYGDALSAQRALSVDHTVDGRRVEAKIALPKGDPCAARSTRIFVARIPGSVSEQQFRQYFEQFGRLQDAYMPKDHAKQGYRGIGFVTFALADAVERVMACKHWMNGQEVAIDRATPKEDTPVPRMVAKPPPQRHSFDNGARIVGPGLTPVMKLGSQLGVTSPNPFSMRSLSEDSFACNVLRNMEVLEQRQQQRGCSSNGNVLGGQTSLLSGAGSTSADEQRSAVQLHNSFGMRNLNSMHAAAAAASAAAAAAAAVSSQPAGFGNFAKAQIHSPGLNMMQMASIGSLPSSSDLGSGMISPNNSGSNVLLPELMGLGSGGASGNGYSNSYNLMASAQSVAPKRNSLDMGMLKRMDNAVIANARAGPRIFVGKLTKETTEGDVKEYFQRFGYVMDVYMPKAKDNKMEHRGFGFVTFETEAALQRVVAAGMHRLKGSTIAIDIAMPKVEDAQDIVSDTQLDANFLAAAAAQQYSVNIPNMMQQLRL